VPDDFPSAAVRHWDNSAFLAQQARWQEAAYLAGYAAECALKKLAEVGGLPARPFGHELSRLIDDGLVLALLLSPRLKRYPQALPSGALPGLRRWSESHRYETTGFMAEAEFRQIVQEAHQAAESILIGLVLDGDLQELPQ